MASRRKPGEPILAIVGASHAPSQGRGTFTPAGLMAEAAAHALADAGVDRRDVDGIFSAGRGEGGAFVGQGVLRPGGRFPANTNGGGLSCRHPGMLGMHLALEAMAQLRDRAGARQVQGARRALVHGLGGVHMTGVTAVLSAEPQG